MFRDQDHRQANPNFLSGFLPGFFLSRTAGTVMVKKPADFCEFWMCWSAQKVRGTGFWFRCLDAFAQELFHHSARVSSQARTPLSLKRGQRRNLLPPPPSSYSLGNPYGRFRRNRSICRRDSFVIAANSSIEMNVARGPSEIAGPKLRKALCPFSHFEGATTTSTAEL